MHLICVFFINLRMFLPFALVDQYLAGDSEILQSKVLDTYTNGKGLVEEITRRRFLLSLCCPVALRASFGAHYN